MQTGKDLCSLFGVIEDETIDEVAMDDLFREILAVPPMPSSAAQTLVGEEAEVPRQDQLSANANTDVNLGKKMQIEMQRLFDLTGTTLGLTIDGIPPLSVEESGNTALELGPQRMGGIDRPHAAGILEQCPRPGFPTQPPVRNSHSLFFMCSLSLIGFLMRVCRLHPPYSVGQGPSHCQQRLPRDSDGQPQCRVMSCCARRNLWPQSRRCRHCQMLTVRHRSRVPRRTLDQTRRRTRCDCRPAWPVRCWLGQSADRCLPFHCHYMKFLSSI